MAPVVFVDSRAYEAMPMEPFEQGVRHLQAQQFSARVVFFNSSDSFVVKDSAQYVQKAKPILTRPNIFNVSTNGKPFRLAKGLELSDAGVNRFTFNIYNDSLKAPIPWEVEKFVEAVEVEAESKILKRDGNPGIEVERRRETEILDNKIGDTPNKTRASSMSFRGLCLQPFTIICIDPKGASVSATTIRLLNGIWGIFDRKA
jgi:hypothetical protein